MKLRELKARLEIDHYLVYKPSPLSREIIVKRNGVDVIKINTMVPSNSILCTSSCQQLNKDDLALFERCQTLCATGDIDNYTKGDDQVEDPIEVYGIFDQRIHKLVAPKVSSFDNLSACGVLLPSSNIFPDISTAEDALCFQMASEFVNRRLNISGHINDLLEEVSLLKKNCRSIMGEDISGTSKAKAVLRQDLASMSSSLSKFHEFTRASQAAASLCNDAILGLLYKDYLTDLVGKTVELYGHKGEVTCCYKNDDSSIHIGMDGYSWSIRDHGSLSDLIAGLGLADGSILY